MSGDRYHVPVTRLYHVPVTRLDWRAVHCTACQALVSVGLFRIVGGRTAIAQPSPRFVSVDLSTAYLAQPVRDVCWLFGSGRRAVSPYRGDSRARASERLEEPLTVSLSGARPRRIAPTPSARFSERVFWGGTGPILLPVALGVPLDTPLLPQAMYFPVDQVGLCKVMLDTQTARCIAPLYRLDSPIR